MVMSSWPRGQSSPCYGPRPRPQPCMTTTVLLAPLNVSGPDLADDHTIQPQYCRFSEKWETTSSVMYLIEPEYVISMPNVISY